MGKLWSFFSSIVMLGLLVLTTIGLPIAAKANSLSNNKVAHSQQSDDNPFSNTNEEKTSGTNTLTITEEYMHDNLYSDHIHPIQVSIAYIHAHEATYIAFHGEHHCPPPNILF